MKPAAPRLAGISQVPTVLFLDPDLEGSQRLAAAIADRCATGIVAGIAGANQAIATHVPTIIVTELDLPDGNGIDFIRRIHAAPQTSNVLLMVLSRRRGVGEKIAALTAGADDFLVKPVSPEAFAFQVRRLLRFRQIFTY